MCLSKETVYGQPQQKEVWAWKALDYSPDQQWLTGPHFGRRIKYDTWMTARTTAYGDAENKGWYCFISREAAEGYSVFDVAVRVKVRGIIARGTTGGRAALRALEIYFPREVIKKASHSFGNKG